MNVRSAANNTRACSCILAALTIIAILSGPAAFAAGKKQASGIEWVSYENGLDTAGRDGRFVVVDFYTSWCRDCKKMDADTFSDPEVVRMLSEGFAAVKVDGEERPELVSGYGVFAYPTVWILAPDGTRIHQRIGYVSAEEFRIMLEYAVSGASKECGFKEFAKRRAGRKKM